MSPTRAPGNPGNPVSLILDAYNVLYFGYVLPERYALLTAPQLGQLLDRLNFHPGPIYIVCDGTPKPIEDQSLELGRSRLIYSGKGREADDVIDELVDREPHRKQTTVVSNDRFVQRVGRHGGCQVLGSEEFMREVAAALRTALGARHSEAAGPEKPTSTSPADAEAWMKKFGLRDNAPPPSPPAEDLDRETDHWLREFGFIDDEP